MIERNSSHASIWAEHRPEGRIYRLTLRVDQESAVVQLLANLLFAAPRACAKQRGMDPSMWCSTPSAESAGFSPHCFPRARWRDFRRESNTLRLPPKYRELETYHSKASDERLIQWTTWTLCARWRADEMVPWAARGRYNQGHSFESQESSWSGPQHVVGERRHVRLDGCESSLHVRALPSPVASLLPMEEVEDRFQGQPEMQLCPRVECR